MSEKMLVTQALDERDLLKKKITDKIAKASFVDTIKENEENVFENRVSKEAFAKQAEAAFQQINDLITRYGKIEAAIIASNAVTSITTSYGTMTVAAAIALRGRLREQKNYPCDTGFEEMLTAHMEQELEERLRYAEQKNKQLQTTSESMRLSILGKDTKVREDKPLAVVDAYVKENTTQIVDPLDVRDKIRKLREKQDTLLTELETQIKVSNATTLIEI